jgi:hypothetical protein
MKLKFIAPTLPDGYCNMSQQELFNWIFDNLEADLTNVDPETIYSEDEPDPEDRDKTWGRLLTDGSIERLYRYIDGGWVSRHPVAPGEDERRIYVGSSGDLETYDGGSSGAVGDAAGPMWEIDTEFAGRVPVGVGTVPDTAITYAVGANAGSGQVTLTMVNLPEDMPLDNTWSAYRTNLETGSPQWLGPNYIGSSTTPSEATTTENFVNDGGGQAFDIAQPGRGVYFIKRTARIYYTPS